MLKKLIASALFAALGAVTLYGINQAPVKSEPQSKELKPEPVAKPGTSKLITEDGGQPVGDNQNSRTAGANGPGRWMSRPGRGF